jgi:hypothetical protein
MIGSVQRLVDGPVLRDARARALDAVCPWCRSRSNRVPGRYQRRLSDAAIGGARVVIRLMVRRFRCINDGCTAAATPSAATPACSPAGTVAPQVVAAVPKPPAHPAVDHDESGPARQRDALAEVHTACPDLHTASAHVRDFAVLMRDLRGAEIPDWITKVNASENLPAIRTFATGLIRDLDVVRRQRPGAHQSVHHTEV